MRPRIICCIVTMHGVSVAWMRRLKDIARPIMNTGAITSLIKARAWDASWQEESTAHFFSRLPQVECGGGRFFSFRDSAMHNS